MVSLRFLLPKVPQLGSGRTTRLVAFPAMRQVARKLLSGPNTKPPARAR